ncbi:MAG: outer membrane protein, partial [Rhodospirillales bacterium]
MKMRKGLTVGTLGLMASALIGSAAMAEGGHPTGYYLGLGGGLNMTMDSDIDGSGFSHTGEFDPGWAGVITFGHAYESGFRAELEGSYRANDIDSVSGLANPGGDVSSWAGMLNGYYDINTGTRFTPYVGLGIGGAYVEADGVKPINGSTVNDDDAQFAYQAIAGVNVTLSENISAFADYRYMRTLELGMSTSAGRSFDAEYANHTGLLGLKWHFNVPKKPMAAAEPAPMPEPVKMVEKAPE